MRPRFHRIRYALLPLLIGLYASPIATAQTAQSEAPPIQIPRLLPGYSGIRRDRVTELADSIDRSRDELERLLERPPQLIEAGKLLDEAYLLWNAGKHDQACKLWRKIQDEYPELKPAFDAQRNLAEAARRRGDRIQSVNIIRKIIDTPIADESPHWEQGCSITDKHFDCLHLSDLLLEMGDLHSSLEYARLALEKYPSPPICSFAMEISPVHLLKQRIPSLQQAIHEGKQLSIEPVEDWAKGE